MASYKQIINDPNMRDSFRKVLLKYDPIGIYFSDDGNINEYDIEINPILDYLRLLTECPSFDELHNKVVQIFIEMFWNVINGMYTSYCRQNIQKNYS